MDNRVQAYRVCCGVKNVFFASTFVFCDDTTKSELTFSNCKHILYITCIISEAPFCIYLFRIQVFNDRTGRVFQFVQICYNDCFLYFFFDYQLREGLDQSKNKKGLHVSCVCPKLGVVVIALSLCQLFCYMYIFNNILERILLFDVYIHVYLFGSIQSFF